MCRSVEGELRDARLALERWTALQRACEHRRTDTERRFRRRAYERARDRALVAVAMHGTSATAPFDVGRTDAPRVRGQRTSVA